MSDHSTHPAAPCPLCSNPGAMRAAATRGLSHDQAVLELLDAARPLPQRQCEHIRCEPYGECVLR